MPSIQEALNLGDLLKYEAPNLYSRDLATVASGQNRFTWVGTGTRA